jgi:hypothetical protein
LCQPPAQRGGVDEVDEGPLAADLHDRKPLPVAGLERLVARDVDLLEGVPELDPEDVPGLLAEVAALRVVQDDVTDRCRG